jgi:hypothetical protein
LSICGLAALLNHCSAMDVNMGITGLVARGMGMEVDSLVDDVSLNRVAEAVDARFIKVVHLKK